MMKNKNITQIYLYGMRRSGIHAITHYILGHIIRKVPNWEEEWKEIFPFREGYFIHFNCRVNQRAKRIKYPQYGNFQIISHESLKEFPSDKKKLLYQNKVKNSNKKLIVLLRDPFNHFSSIIMEYKIQKRKLSERTIKKRLNLLSDRWIRYAEFFMQNKKNDYFFPLSYNVWFVNKKYREELSKFIEKPHTDFGLNKVGSAGSSFDLSNYDGKAQEMKVLERWKKLPIKYRYIFDEKPKLRKLSKEIFNFNPF